MRRHSNQQLVQEPRERKDHCARKMMAPASANEGRVDVPSHKMIHGLVPRPPVRPHRRTVPPLHIEFAIPEPHDFRQGIENGLEDGEEAGEPDDQGDGAEFHEALYDGGDV